MNVSIFTHEQIDTLVQEAINSPRLRVHSVLHESHHDIVQRVIIALAEGTYIPPHCHELPNQWEQFQIIRGDVDLLIFDDAGYIVDIIALGERQDNFLALIPPLTYHTLICRSASAVIMEVKEGPFDEHFAKSVPKWSSSEDVSMIARQSIMKMMSNLVIGKNFCT
ncbi:WbuC family cupin fold metalloprotein [Citrobacter amalonaticus]|uniref:WbuC family cupin fold metalloprotein n=1 Tax=Citrobacter amalonaticus TaxID=35703 RepID=UPI00300C07D8